MADKKMKSRFFEYSISGEFDLKAADGFEEELASKLDGKSVKGAILDFSEATFISAAGISALRRIGEQMSKDGKELIVREMKSEMYKALKVAGTSDAVTFSHRSVSPPSQ